MRRRHYQARSRSGLIGPRLPAACVPMSATGASVMPSFVDLPGLRPGPWRVLRPGRGPAPGTLPWWYRRFADPQDLVAFKGSLLAAIFLAGGFLGGG